MLSLQPSRWESCVSWSGRRSSASHSIVNSLRIRTRARHRIQGVIKAIDNHLYTEMRLSKLCRRNVTAEAFHAAGYNMNVEDTGI